MRVGYGTATVNLTLQQGPKRYAGAQISSEILPMLSAAPLLGRGFNGDDDKPGAPLTVLLGEQVWRDDFGGDPAVIGRVTFANGKPATIIGVMPAQFQFPLREQVWVPRQMGVNDAIFPVTMEVDYVRVYQQ